MRGNDEGIVPVKMEEIDVAFKEAPESPDPDVETETNTKPEAAGLAVEFKKWLSLALRDVQGLDLAGSVCFVDYTVFQDAKTRNPYFYLVSPTIETKNHYLSAVKELVEGEGGQEDCFSVAFHPDFVGIGDDDKSVPPPNELVVISIGSPVPRVNVSSVVKAVGNWDSDHYLLWSQNNRSWPPTSKNELRRICGRHTLEECLGKFQTILAKARYDLCDSSGRPLTYLFCVPFLILDSSSSRATSNLPFSEIAAALFLGVSHDGNPEQARAAFSPFVRTLALRTYRAGMRRAGEAGQAAGLEQAIETFAHQIKSVANAMNTTWLVRLERWEEIRRAHPEKAERIAGVRVLPVPQLFQAIRDTLILWSQTRRLTDLYPPDPSRPLSPNPQEQTMPIAPWPCKFSEVVHRAWILASSARFAQRNMSRNFEADDGEVFKVWDQADLTEKLQVEGIDTPLGDWRAVGRQAETWISDVTRLLAAIFDNSFEHGIPNTVPEVRVNWNAKNRIVSAAISNVVERPAEDLDSRIRPGMKGSEVLSFLKEKLNAELTLPSPTPMPGDIYKINLEIPLPLVLVP